MKIFEMFQKIDENLDEALAKIGIILGVFVAIVSALNYGSLILLGAGTSFVCFSYVMIKKIKKEKITNYSKNTIYILLTTFFLFLSCSIFILYFSESYIIPISFYILISALYTIICIEIFFINEKSKLRYIPLFQIIIVSLLLRLAIYFQYPSILGVDPWETSTMLNDIASRGYFPSEYMYSKFPLFPFHSVASLLITGLEYKYCLFLTIGIIELSSISFVFFISRSICNFKTGVLVSLLFSFYPAFIAFGTHSIIAMSMGITIFAIVCYLIIKNYKEQSIKLTILLIVFLITAILNHTIVPVICLFLIFSFIIGKYLYRFIENKKTDKDKASITLTLFFGVSLLGYWMWVSGFIGYIAESIKFAFQVAEGEYIKPSSSLEKINIFESFFENIQFYLIIFLLVFGVLVWLNKKNRTYERYQILVFAGAIYLLLAVVNITGYDALLPDRWEPFLFIFLAIIICFSLIEFSKKSKTSGKMIVASIVFILSFSMIISNQANVNAPLYNSVQRCALEKSEMNAADFIYQNSNETIYTDVYESLYFRDILQSKYQRFNKSFFENNELSIVGLSLIKKYNLLNYFEVFDESLTKKVGYSNSVLIEGKKFNMRLYDNADKVYDSESVSIYQI